ncbi:MAG: sigma-70 family RNA polymerase sigma factor [Desulfobulbaceae bacterium]|nr:sigma-70 family RNA polymerase sigma factor [Desulfobulbaceae bacterium]
MTRSKHYQQQIFSRETWATSMQWVNANKRLVRQIASPYFKFMAGDSEDLYQEATIAAYNALICCRQKDERERFVPFFRVIFKTNCIKLASGIQTVHCLEEYFLPLKEETAEKVEPEADKVDQVLQSVSKRQRQICLWLLDQPTPVSALDIAREFKVSKRHAYRLISNTLQRISEVSQ